MRAFFFRRALSSYGSKRLGPLGTPRRPGVSLSRGSGSPCGQSPLVGKGRRGRNKELGQKRNIFDQVQLPGKGKALASTFFPVSPLSDDKLFFLALRRDASILFNYELLEEGLKH